MCYSSETDNIELKQRHYSYPLMSCGPWMISFSYNSFYSFVYFAGLTGFEISNDVPKELSERMTEN